MSANSQRVVVDDRPISPWTRTMDNIYGQHPLSVPIGSHYSNNLSDYNIFDYTITDNDAMSAPAEENDPVFNPSIGMTTEMPLAQESAIPGPRRKRNNSLIPPELMTDKSEGGRERAALATVFGVREYTESKIFWERQVAAYHQDGPLGSSNGSPAEDDDGEEGEEAEGNINKIDNRSNINTDGFVSITGRHVVSSPIGSRPSFSPRELHQRKETEISIASLVDSVFESSGSASGSGIAAPGALDLICTQPDLKQPKNRELPPSLQLPTIPVVSKFNDLHLDRSTPSSVSVPKPRPSSFASSVQTSFSLDPTLGGSVHEVASVTSEIRYANTHDIPAPLVFTEPPAIFDYLESDEDDRIIIWGPDPQALSASMATTTVAGKMPSVSSASRKTPIGVSAVSFSTSPTAPPNIKGFSSNTTTTIPTATSLTDQPKQYRRGRWKDQLLPDGFKLSKATLPLKKSRPISALMSSKRQDDLGEDPKGSRFFKFSKKHDRRNRFANDQAAVKYAELPKVIEAATIEKLVEKLTVSLDYTFMTDFFLTYRAFISPMQLCKLLSLRFRWGLETDDANRRIVRIRTFVVLRHWLLNYFVHDFIPNRDLRIYLTSFLNDLPHHKLIRNSPRDQRIVKSLKRVVRRLKKVYYARSSASDRVKVIPPPPPTQEQERVEEMVRAKLAQHPIRRKTAIVSNVNVSDKHHGNMAVQDTRLAPVLVVGSVRNGTGVNSSPDMTSLNHMKRNVSNTAMPKFRRRDQLEEMVAVKESYLKRMEQQKRIMSVDGPEVMSIKENPLTTNDDGGSVQASIMTDDSLESELSPGTTDDELSVDGSEDEDMSMFSRQQGAEYLKHERRRLEEEEELRRAEFFSGAPDADKRFSTTSLRSPLLTSSDLPAEERNGTSITNASDSAVQDLHMKASSSSQEAAVAASLAAAVAAAKSRKLTRRSQQSLTSRQIPDSTEPDARIIDHPSLPQFGQEQDLAETAPLEKMNSIPTYQPQLAGRWVPKETEPADLTQGSDHIPSSSRSMPSRKKLSISSANDAKLSSISQPNVPVAKRIVELDLPQPQGSGSIAPSEAPSRRLSALYPKSFILYYRSERMAKQLCLIESQVLRTIDWEEMVHCRWTKMAAKDSLPGDDTSEFTDDDLDRPDVNYTRRARQIQLARAEHEGGIEQVIKRFNAVCQWVASEIVRTRALDERVRVVEKFIRLAQKCKLYCNFATLVQILLGLQSPAVSRLRKTWDKVGSSEKQLLHQLSDFTSPMKNWKHIRDAMTEVAEEYGMSPVEVQIELPGTNQHAKTKIKIPFGGCIPFLGIYLSDLVFNSEQPPYLQPSHDHHRIYYANNRMLNNTPPVLKQPLVNFRKYRITATVIKRVLTFQSLARRYSFDRDDEVYYLCSELHKLDQETIRKLSYEIES
ncbi:hypothetical protein BX666DRAFT_1251635 [Dichotomocladium elegans]|nr:hypothetical protein BX666DRAFT_1251635 [Dichotomocladium elegans]